ncbi:hypothetical protein N2152v2_000534 [Parachlorella kessleri]
MGKFKYGFYGTLTTGSLVKIFSALEKEAGMHKGDTFCDFGAGLGGVLLFAQALGYSSYGVEFDGDKARQAYTACCLAYKRYRVEFGHLSDEMESKLLWHLTTVDVIMEHAAKFWGVSRGRRKVNVAAVGDDEFCKKMSAMIGIVDPEATESESDE